MRKIYAGITLGLLILVSSFANATTYTYTGPNYTAASGVFNTAMNVTGSFTTAVPLPPNMVATDIGPLGTNLVSSWSFNDGVDTFDNTNSTVLFQLSGYFRVTTNASGQITNHRIGFMSPLGPHVVAQPMNVMFLDDSTTTTQALSSYPCDAVTAGVCTLFAPGGGANFAQNLDTPGLWSVSAPSAVPSLSFWGISLLVGLLGIFGFNRKSNIFCIPNK